LVLTGFKFPHHFSYYLLYLDHDDLTGQCWMDYNNNYNYGCLIGYNNYSYNYNCGCNNNWIMFI